MGRWLRGFGIGAGAVLACTLALLLSVLGLAATEGGSRWLIALTGTLAPGELTVEASEGTLLSAVTLRGLEYRRPPHSARIETLSLAWRPAALLRGRLHVRRFELSGVRYAGPPGQRRAAPAVPHEPLLPLPLHIDVARLRDIEIQRGDARYRLAQAQLAAQAGARALRVERLALVTPALQATLNGRLDYGAPPTLDLHAEWQAAPSGRPELLGSGRLSGPLEALRVEHRLAAPFTVATTGTVAWTDAGLHVALEGTWSDAAWPVDGALDAGEDGARLRSTGRYRIQGDPRDVLAVEVETNIDFQIEPLRSLMLDLEGHITVAPPYPFRANAVWTGALADGTAIAGSGVFEGERRWVDLEHRITRPARLETGAGWRSPRTGARSSTSREAGGTCVGP